MINADIESVKLDALMLNLTLDGKYVESFSSNIVTLTNCGRYTIESINKINSGQSNFILEYDENEESSSEIEE